MSTARNRLAISIGKHFKAWELEAIKLLAQAPVEVIGWSRAEHDTGNAQSLPQRVTREVERDQLFATADASQLSFLRNATNEDAARADIVLHLGGSWPPTAAGVNAPRHWIFRHADGAPAHAYPPGLREWLLGLPHARLQLVEANNGHLLRECCIPIGNPTTMAIVMLELGIRWPHDILREEASTPRTLERPLAETLGRLATPGILHLLKRRWLGLFGGEAIKLLDQSGPWNIGVLHQPVHVLLQEDGSRNVRWLPSPQKGKSRMEPFGYLDQDGDLNALYRKGDEDGRHGQIARVRPKADNVLKRSRIMLDGVDDAAYPYTVTLNGAPHALVANLAGNETRLCAVVDTNDKLEAGRAILNEALHAPTLFHHDGHWWLFGTRAPLPEAELFAWHAKDPWGPFEAHAQSPLKCDVRNARPAGTPFVHEGALYRPALDSSDPTQLAVWINRVDLLTPEAFVEVPIRHIAGFEASAYGRGIRTICAMGEVTLVDGLRSPVVEGHRANAQRGKSGRSKRK